jgi:hypothetical protein
VFIGLAGAHSEVVTGPASALPPPRTRRSLRALQGQRHVVEPVDEPVLDVLVDLEPEDSLGAVDGLVVEIDPRLSGRGDRAAVVLVEDDGQQAILGAVGEEDVGERRRDHRVKAVVLERPDGVLREEPEPKFRPVTRIGCASSSISPERNQS